MRNQYDDDLILKSYLKRKLPASMHKDIEPGLLALGHRTTTEILELGYQAERERPVHIPFDAWGNRIDNIQTSDAWKKLAKIAVEEKLVATAYERQHLEWSRVHQMARVYLFGPSSAIYTCPLAMSDGAARAIELYGDIELKNYAFQKLISQDTEDFWTSGQWMTEKTGGSDVGTTTTEARLENNTYKLYGSKWFTSATTSEMAMTLARVKNDEPGAKGLSLFYLELRDDQKKLNSILIHRLKDKMGTKALPTAELELQGTSARLVGGQGHGVKKIASLFNITRVWNACTAVSNMRRGLALAKSYAEQRYAFGKLLKDHPLHLETLTQLQVEFEAGFLLVMRVAELLGKEEVGVATPQENAILRILTPVAKLYTAKQAIAVSSEIIESFGGAGYVEDTHLPRLLRDSQVLAIWEGTTNILSLDTLRAIQKENALEPLLTDLDVMMNQIKKFELLELVQKVKRASYEIKEYMQKIKAESDDFMLANSRNLSFSIAQTYMAALLIDHAQWAMDAEKSPRAHVVAQRWCEKKLVHFLPFNRLHTAHNKLLMNIP